MTELQRRMRNKARNIWIKAMDVQDSARRQITTENYYRYAAKASRLHEAYYRLRGCEARMFGYSDLWGD